MTRVAYFVTAHGYGHGVRSCDLVRGLKARDPGGVVRIVTDLPHAFLANRLPFPGIEYAAGSFDVGMVQLDSIRVDVPATFSRALNLYTRRRELAHQLECELKAFRPDVVVADIPSLPMDVASRMGLPVVAVGNFAWNWIYAPFVQRDPGWRELIDWFESGYRKADLLLQLPFSEPMQVFPKREQVGVLARPGVSRRVEIARHFGCDPAREWVLFSFSDLAWSPDVAAQVARDPDRCYFSVQPLAWPGSGIIAVDRTVFSFVDVLASVDAVVSKPGYGLLSDCVVNEKPLVYAEREDFAEYPVLVEAIGRYLRNAHIPAAELYRGNVAPYLEKLREASPPAERIAAGGELVGADILLRMARG